jgi:hypothetical protein
MHSKRKWLSVLLILMLSLVVFAGTALADSGADNSADAAAPQIVPDNDSDGLDANQEAALGTDDNNPDSDGDGLCDGVPAAPGCAPYIGGEDVNGNGVVDATETDPAVADTDGDGIDDGDEVKWHGLCATSAGFDPLVFDSSIDDDGGGFQDGLSHLQELNGWNNQNVPHGYAPTNPCIADEDGDTVVDGDEVDGVFFNGVVTNPHEEDTDGDLLCDVLERNNGKFMPAIPYPIEGAAVLGGGDSWLLSAITNCAAQLALVPPDWNGGVGSDPTNHDTDGDGRWDGREASGADNEYTPGGPPHPYAAGGPGAVFDPNNPDTDGDSIDDATEVTFVSPNNGHSMDPTAKDTDGDGVNDDVEFNNCMDPAIDDAGVDYDGDGLGSKAELDNGLDPCDIDSYEDGVNEGW